MLELRGVKKIYDEKAVCDAVNLTVKEGDFFFILGPSGSGKSTLLKIISGLLAQDAGNVFFCGNNIDKNAAFERPFNMVFQNYSLFPHLTVAENIAFGLKMKKKPRAEIKARVEELLELFHIKEQADKKKDQLSGGEQQRVALARAIANNPKILLLDEPLSALDEKLRLAMQHQLKEIKKRSNITFIYVTHNQDEALSMGDMVAVMKNGKILQVSTPTELYYRPATRFVAEFVGEMNILGYRITYLDNGAEQIVHFNNESDFENFSKPGISKKEVEIIRPEHVTISLIALVPGEFSVVKSGLVLESDFKGNLNCYLISCADGLLIKVACFNVGVQEKITVNSPVHIGWKNEFSKYVQA
jgi:spermidine/putrescine transport system ATP-binding protein